MPLSESRKKANRKWDENNLKRQTVSFPIKEYELMQEYIQKNDLKKNNFIRKAISYAIKNEIK